MFKIRTVSYLLALLLYICLGGCEQRQQEKVSTIEPKCISSQSTCVIKSSLGSFSILFNIDPVITETSFDIFFTSESKYVIKKISAHMEGKNMFMGKIPLFFESLPNNNQSLELYGFEVNDLQSEPIVSDLILKKKRYIANTMLGSCSEENMRWIIHFNLSLETTQGEEVTERFNIEFDSIRR